MLKLSLLSLGLFTFGCINLFGVEPLSLADKLLTLGLFAGAAGFANSIGVLYGKGKLAREEILEDGKTYKVLCSIGSSFDYIVILKNENGEILAAQLTLYYSRELPKMFKAKKRGAWWECEEVPKEALFGPNEGGISVEA